MSQLIYKKMSDVMNEIGAVAKKGTNTVQGFKFRGIDQFVNALYPALTKHGVFMTTEVLEASSELKDVERSSGKKGIDKHVALKMKYTFHAEDGSSVSSSVPSEGLDSGDKATNKALSAALKYALIQTFSIPTEDMEEADRESPVLGISAPKELKEAAKATLKPQGTVTIQPVPAPVIPAKPPGVVTTQPVPEPLTPPAAVPLTPVQPRPTFKKVTNPFGA